MIVKIDTKIWATPAVYAKECNLERSTLHRRIERNQVESWYIEELDITLIKRGSEVIRPYLKKKSKGK